MSDAHKSSKAAFVFIFVLLIIPGLNWIIAPLLAGKSALRLLSRGHSNRLLGLLAGSTLWSFLSFYLVAFERTPRLALCMMIAFPVWTWFLLRLIEAWDIPDEPAQVSVAGRIQN